MVTLLGGWLLVVVVVVAFLFVFFLLGMVFKDRAGNDNQIDPNYNSSANCYGNI